MEIELEKSFFPVSFTSSEYLSFKSQQNVGLLRHTCQLMSIFYNNIGLFIKCFMNSLNNWKYRKDI